MPLACLSCSQDSTNPCYGTLIRFKYPSASTITETDNVKISLRATASSTGELEIAPFINENSSGQYFYQFNIIFNGETYNFLIFNTGGATWNLQRNNDGNYTPWATKAAGFTNNCIGDLSGWTTTPALIPDFNIIETYTAILSAPTNNEDDCTPPLNVPISVSGKSIPTRIDSLYKCLDIKGTEYLNKLRGGFPCSNLELTKLSLIIELLKKRNCETALPCLYNRREFNVTLYKGDFCSDINALYNNTVNIPGNFIGYEGANFTTSCAISPAYDYVEPDQICDACPPNYTEDFVNVDRVCVETTSGNATRIPANPETALITAGDKVGSYNIGGLNLLQNITNNLDNLPITLVVGTAVGNSTEGTWRFRDASNIIIQGDDGTVSINGTSYNAYSKGTNTKHFVQANNPLFCTNTNWTPTAMGSSGNTVDVNRGMLGYSGIWVNNTNADCPSNNIAACEPLGYYITTYTCLSITGENQDFLIGISADNAIKINIKGPGFGNGQNFVDFIILDSSDRDPFLYYHVFPITLSTGKYTLEIKGFNWAAPALQNKKAISVDVFKMTVDYFKQNFCNTNLPRYTDQANGQAIIGDTDFPTGDVVIGGNGGNLAAKRTELFSNANCIFSLGATAFSGDLIGLEVPTEDVTYSCPAGADINFCSSATLPTCSTVTDTIPYYDCCDTEACNEKFEGLSNKIIHVEYDSTLDRSTLHLENNFPTSPGNTCINYCISYSPTTETYLETFLNYISKECAQCITKETLSNEYSNFDAVDKVPAVSEGRLTTQSGDTLTFENGIDNITL